MKSSIEMNNEEREYVVSDGGAVSCLPYEDVFAQALELAKRLRERGVAAKNPARRDIGTLEQYEHYQHLFKLYAAVPDIKTWFDGRTPEPVQQAFEQLRKTRRRVRVFYGDAKTGRAWLHESDVIGRLSRSGGAMKLPLLMVDKMGGSALLSHCIVRLIDLTAGLEVYRHPQFHLPAMHVEKASKEDKAWGFTHKVYTERTDGTREAVANFHSETKARLWVSFMAGETNNRRRPRLAKAA